MKKNNGRVFKSIYELIGNTPLVELVGFNKVNGFSKIKIIAKLESFNPASSVKDRVALGMIEDAEKSGKLKAGSVIIEPTSGNTGIGLAMIAAAKGYRLILTMPVSMSEERRNLLKAYGAELVLTEGAKGMLGAIERAKQLNGEIKNSIILQQFENMANPKTHFDTTGQEIWADTGGKIDYLVCTVGTGGTISGAGRFLKEKNPNLVVVAVEPDDSPVLSGGTAAPHGIQGIGAGFVPKTLDMNVFDEIVRVKTADAYDFARRLARTEGILVGISSGAALWAARKIGEDVERVASVSGAVKSVDKSNDDIKNIVVVFPDSGERYLSTPLFKEGDNN